MKLARTLAVEPGGDDRRCVECREDSDCDADEVRRDDPCNNDSIARLRSLDQTPARPS